REFPRDDGLELPPELVSRFLVNHPPDEPELPVKKQGDKLDEGGMRQKDEGGGKKQRDDAGKVGKRDEKPKEPEIAGDSRGAVAAKVRGMGLLGALSGGDTLRDALDVANVGSILSGLNSARTDLGGGSGGRGLRGVNA